MKRLSLLDSDGADVGLVEEGGVCGDCGEPSGSSGWFGVGLDDEKAEVSARASGALVCVPVRKKEFG